VCAVIATPEQPQVPRFVRGSVVVNRRRCGKPNCRCAEGTALHETTVLSYSERGKTHFLAVPPDKVGAVRAAVERYRVAQRSLEEEANAGLAALAQAWGGGRKRP
jgi:hypothetical protein